MKQKIRSHKRILIITSVAVLLTAGLIFYYQNRHDNENKNPVAEDGINYSPPTETEKKETEQHKQVLGEKAGNDSSQTTSVNSSNKRADVTMTYIYFEDDKVSAGGIINNLFEDGGTCTLVLIKDSLRVATTSIGMADVNKTTCPNLSINRNRLQTGQWSAILEYSSSSSKGSSSTRLINVP